MTKPIDLPIVARTLHCVVRFSACCVSGLCLIAAGHAAGGGAGSAAAQEKAPPNIVILLADDLGYKDLSCYGSSFYETPNLDRMAREGIRFTDAYAACPVCSPTRASIQTGRYPQRTRITDYIGAPGKQEWKRNTKLRPADYSDRLAKDEVTMAEALKQRGYATFFAGKWHLGPEGWWPEDQGYDINKGGIDRGGPYGGKKYFSPYQNPRLPDGPEGEHLPDRLARETAAFIEANKERPFFAFFSFYSVHTPLMARPDLQKKYEEKRARLGLKATWGREDTRDVRMTQEHAVYAGMVEAMDQAVGTVLAQIKKSGLDQKTFVLFTSDNGGLSTSEGWPTSNAPLRGGKGWLYEGGVREPLIIRWPGVIAPGSVSAVPVTSPDLLPTAIELAGGAEPGGVTLDGVSLVPLLRGTGGLPLRPLFWHYPHYGNQGGAPGGAVRRGPWKLIEWYEDGRRELFNLDADIGEKNDLAASKPAIVEEMAALLAAWRKQVGAAMPTPNASYDATKPSGRSGGKPKEKSEALPTTRD